MKAWILFLLFLVTVSCTSSSSKPTNDQRSVYPGQWSQPSTGKYLANECVSINGLYYSHGLSNSTISERFSNPIFERSFFNMRDIADESNLFKGTIDVENRRLYFDIFDSQHNMLAPKLFKQYSKCEAGWIVMESQTKGGAGDSPVKSSISEIRLGLAADGSLIINTHVEGVWRKYLFGSETRVSDIWYKFERVR